MSDPLTELQAWYLGNCDGDWEHTYGVEIDTLDNPGWRVNIHVEGTPLAEKPFARIEIDRSEDDWLFSWVGLPEAPDRGGVQAQAFQAACGPENLTEAISVFLRWAQDEPSDAG